MNARWKLDHVHVNFSLSDKTLFAIGVWLQVREVAVTEHAAPSVGLVPPLEAPDPRSDGFLIRSLPVANSQPPLQQLAGYLCYVSGQYRRYYIDLQQNFQEYKQRFSAKTRSTINRKIKKYAEHCGGQINWKLYKSPIEMDEFFILARRVSAKTYQEKLLDAGLPDSEEFRSNMVALASQGCLRGYILFDKERPVSYLFCPVRDGVLLYQYLGYDPDYAQWSVGTILHWHALESIFAENCFRLFDFTEGQGEHKRLFSTHNVECANVFFLRPTLRNFLLAHAHRFFSASSKWSGDVLEKLGIKSKIKKLLRFGI